MRYFIYVICLMGLLCFGCAENAKYELLDFPVLEVNYIDTVKLSDLIEPDYSYIPLAMSTGNLIGDIDRMVITDTSFYMLDSHIAKKIFHFDKLGRMKNVFGVVGAGPGEYGRPTDMVVTQDGVLIIDGTNFSKLLYTHTGDFVKEEKTKYWVSQILPRGDEFVVYSPTSMTKFNKDVGTDVLKVMSSNLEDVEASYFPYEDNHDDIGLHDMISSYNGKVTYVKPIRGEIYDLNSNNQVEPRYKVDFKEYSWPISMEQIAKNQDLCEEVFISKQVMSLIHRLSETSEYFTFQTYMTEAEILDDASSDKWWVLHNKGAKECYAIHNIVNDLDGGSFTFPIAVSNDYFFSLLPVELLKRDKLKQESRDANLERYNSFRIMVDSLDLNANPVLMKYKLKDNISFSFK